MHGSFSAANIAMTETDCISAAVDLTDRLTGESKDFLKMLRLPISTLILQRLVRSLLSIFPGYDAKKALQQLLAEPTAQHTLKSGSKR